jgi:hypothetical protein
MNQQQVTKLNRQGRLIDSCAHLKSKHDYVGDGVYGGIIIANDDNRSLLLAIHGRMDDRVWVAPANLEQITEDSRWEIDGSALSVDSAQALADEIKMASQSAKWFWLSNTINDNLTRFGLRA